MNEANITSVERDATIGIATLVAILQVTFYRTSYRRQLHPDLVLSSGHQPHFEQVISIGRSYEPVGESSLLASFEGVSEAYDLLLRSTLLIQ